MLTGSSTRFGRTRRISRRSVVGASWLLLLAFPVSAQRHLPYLQVFDSPSPIYIDTRVEDPPVNNGRAFAPYPNVGQVFEFQAFAPTVAGRAGFACQLNFLGEPDAFGQTFEVRSVRDWTGTDLVVVPGSGGLAWSTSRMSFADIPRGGYILTAQLVPVGPRQGNGPLRVECAVSIASIPPRRLMRAVGEQQIRWR